MSTTSSSFIEAFSQELNDAKKALLSHAPSSVREYASGSASSDKVRCSILSAPERTSQIMTELATKSGWLWVQDNTDSRIWKKKWCCVVPHTFLYLFDDPKDVKKYGKENFNELLSCGINSAAYEMEYDEEGLERVNPARSNLKPAAIIDLECYKNVNRMQTGYIIELLGTPFVSSIEKNSPSSQSFDSANKETNSPESLRTMYFKGNVPEECDEWSESFIDHRYESARAQIEFYEQENAKIHHQMQDYVNMMEEEEHKRKEAEKEAYYAKQAIQNIQSQVLELARDSLESSVLSIIENAQTQFDNSKSKSSSKLESSNIASTLKKLLNNYVDSNKSGDNIDIAYLQKVNDKRKEVLSTLDQITANTDSAAALTSGLVECIQTMAEYTSFLSSQLISAKNETSSAKKKMVSKTKFDNLQKKAIALNTKQKSMTERISFLESELTQSQHDTGETERSLNLKSTKIQNLEKHKEILKKEILNLRCQIMPNSSNESSRNKGREFYVNMDDGNFNLPSLSDIPPSRSASASRSRSNQNSLVLSNNVFTSNALSMLSCGVTNGNPHSGGALLDTVLSTASDDPFDDISVNSSSDQHSTSSDNMFNQLQNVKHKNKSNNKKWTRSLSCGASDVSPNNIVTSSPNRKKKSSRSKRRSRSRDITKSSNQLKTFDPSSLMCGLNTDSI